MSIRDSLRYEDDLWQGTYAWAGRDIGITVDGDTEPDPRHVAECERWLARLGELEATTINYLRAELGHNYRPGFALSGLVFLGGNEPKFFTVELALDGDDDGLWRVEMDDGRPMNHGRDD